LLLIRWRIAGKVTECIKTYNRFVSHIQELDLVDVGDEKPILTVLTVSRLGPVTDEPELINREKT